ncbi:hypothetical protein LX36DRAFT_715032 [Colletotrichum falcatum]|nr:hypothetical protein LX36DRAFT_715032 [Colletotrichum falcatum]
MPSAVTRETAPLPKRQRPEKTKRDLPWAGIAVIDIGQIRPAAREEGVGRRPPRQALMRASGPRYRGFFSLINTGFTPEGVQRQYDIGQRFFSLKTEDKARYVRDYHDHDDYADMKGRKSRIGDLEIEDRVGVKDGISFFV